MVPRRLPGCERGLHRPRLQHIRLADRGVHLRDAVHPDDVSPREAHVVEPAFRDRRSDAGVLRRHVLHPVEDRDDRHLSDLLHPLRLLPVLRPHAEPHSRGGDALAPRAGHRAGDRHLGQVDLALGVDKFAGHALMARMSTVGNPWIWWTSLPCVAAMPYFVIRHRSFAAAVILLGFITQYAPWFPITRVLFMYHMFGGLIFMVLAL